MPVFTMLEYLKEALSCIDRQTIRVFELMLVDVCTNDDDNKVFDRNVNQLVLDKNNEDYLINALSFMWNKPVKRNLFFGIIKNQAIASLMNSLNYE